MTAVKWFLRLLLLVIVLIAALVIYLLTIFDLDTLKPEIERLVYENSGLKLHLDGDIDWQLYPTLGFAADNVKVNDHTDKEHLVKAEKAAFSVAFKPLLSKQIQANTLYFNGLELNYHVDGSGKSGFDRSLAFAEAEKAKAAQSDNKAQTPESDENTQSYADTPAPLLVSSYPDIKVSNATISYKDAKSGGGYDVAIRSFRTAPISLERPFSVHADVTVKDNQSLDVAAVVDSELDISQQAVYTLRNTQATVNMPLTDDTPTPITISLANLVFNQVSDALRLQDVVVSALGVDTSAQMTVNNVTKSPQFTGTVSVSEFNVRNVLSKMGQSVSTANADVLKKAAFTADLMGSTQYIQMKNIDAQLDGTNISGGFKTQLGQASSAHWFDVYFDSLNLDSYLPPRAETKVSSASQQAQYSDESILPIELLRSLLVQGRLKGDNLQLMEQKYTDLACDVRASKGSVHLKSCGMNALDGRVNADINIDAYSAVPTVKITTDASKLSVHSIVELITNQSPLQGILNTDISLELTGNTVESWLDGANGQVKVSIIDGLLEGLNLRNVIANNIGEEVTQLIELGLAAKDWQIPSTLDKDTVFKNISAPVRLKDGVMLVDNIKADLKTGDSLTGNGQFDLLTQEFDYRLKLKTPNLTQDKHLKDIAWPIRCNGQLSGKPLSWCHLDKQGVKDIVSNLARQKAEGRIRDLVSDKLGIQLDENQSLEDAAKAEAERRAQEKIAEEKRKLQEKIDEEKRRAEEKVQEELKEKLGEAAGEEVTKQLGNVLEGLFGK